MEVQVQLAYKRVIQYDSNWKETKIYNSVQECLQDTKIGEYNLNDVREVLLENGFYGDIYNSMFLKKYKENIKV